MPSLRTRLLHLLSSADQEHGAADPAEAEPGGGAGAGPPYCCTGELLCSYPRLRITTTHSEQDTAQEPEMLAFVAAARAAVRVDGRQSCFVVPPSDVALPDPEWERSALRVAVERSKHGLGIDEGTAVEARLTGLLVWGPGSCKMPSQDSGPAGAAAFGRILIQLPSRCEGGALQAVLGAETTDILAGGSDAAALPFAAIRNTECTVVSTSSKVSAGHRLLLLYDLVHTGQGPPPPVLPLSTRTRVLAFARAWNRHKTEQPPMKLCFLLQDRYSLSALQEQGVEALRGADKAAAQALADACHAGAELDASLALLKCTAQPGVSVGQIYGRLRERLLAARMGEGSTTEEEEDEEGYVDSDEEQELLEEAYERMAELVATNRGWGACKRLRWRSVKAAKFVPLVGQAPAFPVTTLCAHTELAHGPTYWDRAPDRLFLDDDIDDSRQQFRRVGILVYPRRKRLMNEIHADLAGMVLHLRSTLVPNGGKYFGSWEQVACTALHLWRTWRDMLGGGWVDPAEDWSAGPEVVDQLDGWDSDLGDEEEEGEGGEEGGGEGQEGAVAHGAAAGGGGALGDLLGQPVAAALGQEGAGGNAGQGTASAADDVAWIVAAVALGPDLLGLLEGGSQPMLGSGATAAFEGMAVGTSAADLASALTTYLKQNLVKQGGKQDADGPRCIMQRNALALLMGCAARLCNNQLAFRVFKRAAEACSSPGHLVLGPAAAHLLRSFRWPASWQPLLQQWVQTDASSLKATLELLTAAAAAGSPSRPSVARLARARTSTTLLALGAARAVKQGAGQRGLVEVVRAPAKLLLALHSVRTASGALALAVAAEVAQRCAPADELYAASVAVLEALPPGEVAACPVLLKVVCSALAQLSAGIGAAPVEPHDWSKDMFEACSPTCFDCIAVKAFLRDPRQQECWLPATQHLGSRVQWFGTYACLDVTARGLQPGEEGSRGVPSYILTKRHLAHQQAVAAHARRVQQQRSLMDLLLPSLLLAVRD